MILFPVAILTTHTPPDRSLLPCSQVTPLLLLLHSCQKCCLLLPQPLNVSELATRPFGSFALTKSSVIALPSFSTRAPSLSLSWSSCSHLSAVPDFFHIFFSACCSRPSAPQWPALRVSLLTASYKSWQENFSCPGFPPLKTGEPLCCAAGNGNRFKCIYF